MEDVGICLMTAATMAIASRKIEVVNIITTSISSTWLTAIEVSALCAFYTFIFRGLLTVRVY